MTREYVPNCPCCGRRFRTGDSFYKRSNGICCAACLSHDVPCKYEKAKILQFPNLLGRTKKGEIVMINWLRTKWINRNVPSSSKQIEQLGKFILSDVPGEPSQSQGAVETAIRLIRKNVHGVAKNINFQPFNR